MWSCPGVAREASAQRPQSYKITEWGGRAQVVCYAGHSPFHTGRGALTLIQSVLLVDYNTISLVLVQIGGI